MSRRCEYTGNLCGTDTWGENVPCVCAECQAWLCEQNDRLRTALRGLVEAAKQTHIDYDTLCVYVNDPLIRWRTFQASIIKLQAAIAAAEAAERGE